MHLFLSIANYSGSTLIHNLIAPSAATLARTPEDLEDVLEGNAVSSNNFMYKHPSQLYTRDVVLNCRNPLVYDWPGIKRDWNEIWSKDTEAKVYLQKTPHDIFRVQMMSEQFEDLKWIIMVKDPYAYVESLFNVHRRRLLINDPYLELDKLCAHVILVLQTQLENADILGQSAYTMTLEDFLERKEYHVNQIQTFTDGLVRIDFSKQIWIKKKLVSEIINTNEEKIQRMIAKYPDIISEINKFFIPHEALLNEWSYKIRYD
jgi:hypothetical protein